MKQTVLAVLLGATISAQSADSVESHVAAAQALNATGATPLITLCKPEQAARSNPPPRRGGQPPGAPETAPSNPDRSRWAREPLKVFDNLYYVGEREYSSWAITTPAGIIIIDPIYDYSVRSIRRRVEKSARSRRSILVVATRTSTMPAVVVSQGRLRRAECG